MPKQEIVTGCNGGTVKGHTDAGERRKGKDMNHDKGPYHNAVPRRGDRPQREPTGVRSDDATKTADDVLG